MKKLILIIILQLSGLYAFGQMIYQARVDRSASGRKKEFSINLDQFDSLQNKKCTIGFFKSENRNFITLSWYLKGDLDSLMRSKWDLIISFDDRVLKFHQTPGLTIFSPDIKSGSGTLFFYSLLTDEQFSCLAANTAKLAKLSNGTNSLDVIADPKIFQKLNKMIIRLSKDQ